MVAQGASAAFGNASATNGAVTTGGAYSIQTAGVDPTSSQTVLRAILGLLALALGGFVALIVWRRRIA
jgi:hypothetical protein